MKYAKEIIKGICLASLLALLITPKAQAEDRLSFQKFITNTKFRGDLRIRQENAWKSSLGQRDSSRQRFRLRFGLETAIDDITVFFRLASGTGDQRSTNQTFDNLSGQKNIWLDQAYVTWQPYKWGALQAGRMKNPMWKIYSSDLMWDSDYNPEGFAQKFKVQFHDRITGFTNFLQMVLDEDGGDNRDQWMYGYQVGLKTKPMDQFQWDIAGTVYDFKHETASSLGQVGVGEGNTRQGASTVLAATFTIVQLTTQFSTEIMDFPVKVQADYIKNIKNNGSLAGIAPHEQAGYQVGTIFGKASKAKTWEAAYFFKWLEANAALADVVDADWGDGGTNRRGHIFWFSFSPRDYVKLTAKLYHTEVIRPTLTPGPDNINRAQFDIAIKF